MTTKSTVRPFVYVDVETTGLDPVEDTLVEVSYAVEDGPVHTLYFGVLEVPDFIDELIGFTKRGIAGLCSTDAQIDEFLTVSKGATMVSANPPFDRAFLENNDLYRFHYRNLDIESFAMATLELPFVPGMSEINAIINERFGEDLPMGDHTSSGDVHALREAHRWLCARNHALNGG